MFMGPTTCPDATITFLVGQNLNPIYNVLFFWNGGGRFKSLYLYFCTFSLNIEIIKLVAFLFLLYKHLVC